MIAFLYTRTSTEGLCAKMAYSTPPMWLFQAKTYIFLKWYYDQKITFIFSLDFETMFVKHSPSEILSVNFEKKTVNLNCNFLV